MCQPHLCVHCGAEVDHLGMHGLSCAWSEGRHSRHGAINNIIHHSLLAAKIPSRLEPTGLSRSDGKRPDSMTLIPWSSGRFLVWDATCMDTFAPSNLPVAVTRTGAVAERAEGIKMSNYADLDHLYQFVEPMDLDHSNLSKCLVIS